MALGQRARGSSDRDMPDSAGLPCSARARADALMARRPNVVPERSRKVYSVAVTELFNIHFPLTENSTDRVSTSARLVKPDTRLLHLGPQMCYCCFDARFGCRNRVPSYDVVGSDPAKCRASCMFLPIISLAARSSASSMPAALTAPLQGSNPAAPKRTKHQCRR